MRKYPRQIDVSRHNRGFFVTSETIASVLQVSGRTAERWIQARKIPPHYLRLLEYELLGCLPDPAFAGFHCDTGAIVTPQGRRLYPSQLEWIELVYALSKAHGLNSPME